MSSSDEDEELDHDNESSGQRAHESELGCHLVELTQNGLKLYIDRFIAKYNSKAFFKILPKFKFALRTHTGFLRTYQEYKLKNTAAPRYVMLPRSKALRYLYKAHPELLVDARLASPSLVKIALDPINVNPTLDFSCTVEPSNNQKTILKYLYMTFYKSSKANIGLGTTTLQAQAGTGKTFLAAKLISVLKQRAIFIVPNTYLLNQTLKQFREFFPSLVIGQYYAKKKELGDIMVMVINSALHETMVFDHSHGRGKKRVINVTKIPSDEFYSMFGTIIYDEVEQYIAPKFKEIFFRANCKYQLGMSATPVAEKGQVKADFRLPIHLGEIVYADQLPGFELSANNFTLKFDLVKFYGKTEYIQPQVNTDGTTSVPRMINQLASDPYRTQLIVNVIIQLAKDETRFIFVFADRRLFLINLAQQLILHNVLPNLSEDVKVKPDELKKLVKPLLGGATDTEIEIAKTKSRIILTTYQYSGSGVSINKMNTLLFATPRRTGFKQFIGRIFRNGSDESIERYIVDIVDMKTSLKNQSYTRKKVYMTDRNGELNETKVVHWDKVVFPIKDVLGVVFPSLIVDMIFNIMLTIFSSN